MTISVIIAIYNEEKVIAACLESLAKQTKQCEIIVVDDGSTDKTCQVLSEYHSANRRIKNSTFAKASEDKQYIIIIEQPHLGPGAARNLGAEKAHGEILVFVDSDMTFAPDFLAELVTPIELGKSKGTFTKNEIVSNWENTWARCWNYNQGIRSSNRIPENYPDTAPVFRAILASEFRRIGGFDSTVGWTDDWTLSEKLGYQATTTQAKCFHQNPDNLLEVFRQARWVGRNKFMSRNTPSIFINLIRHSPFVSIGIGITKSIMYREPVFIPFKLIYDFGITWGLYSQISGSHKNK